MEKLTKECVLQSAARLEQESQDAVMRDIPQFFEAEIVTRFAGAVPQKKGIRWCSTWSGAYVLPKQ